MTFHLAAVSVLLLLGSTAPADDKSVSTAVFQAKQLAEEGRFAEAEALLRPLGDSAPRSLRARCEAGMGHYAAAASLIQAEAKASGIPVDPRSASGWWVAAARWKASPEALAHHARGYWLVSHERFAEGRSELEEALRIAPGLTDARYHLGFAMAKLGDVASAEREYRAAIAGYGPEERVLLASAQYGLGTLLARQGPAKAREGAELLRKAMAPDGHGRLPVILLSYADALKATGDQVGARSALAEALEGEGKLPDEEAEEIGWELFAQGCRPRPPASGPGVPPVCAPASALAHMTDARVAEQAGQWEAAAAAWRKALIVDPGIGMAHLGLGMALIELEQWPEAEREFRATLATPRMRSQKASATSQRMLAFSLIKQGVRTDEALLLLLDSEGIARDANQRAWFAISEGRAFSLAGLPACARSRYLLVAESISAPEPLRARAKSLLAEMGPAGAKSDVDCFDYGSYKASTLASESARYLKEHPPDWTDKSVVHVDIHPPERYRVRVDVTGLPAPIPKGTAEVAGKMLRAFGDTRDLASQPGWEVDEQIVVREGGATFTLPVTSNVSASLRAGKPKGGTTDLFVILTGAFEGNVVFIATEALANTR